MAFSRRSMLWMVPGATLAVPVGAMLFPAPARATAVNAEDGVAVRGTDVVAYVRSLSGIATGAPLDADRVKAGQEVFAANCVACHGEAGKGNIELGAPDLTDQAWIYGGDAQSIYNTVHGGRQGQMPHWAERLSPIDTKILALYVHTLEGEAK